jgi:hypothetical protein
LEKYGDHVRAIKFESMELCGGIQRIQAKSGILKSFQKELLLQGFDVSKITGDSVKGFCFAGKCIE